MNPEAEERLQRALTLLFPPGGAANVNINTIHANPGGEYELLDVHAEFPDGSSVQAPKITIKLG